MITLHHPLSRQVVAAVGRFYVNVGGGTRNEDVRTLQYRTTLHTARPSKRFLAFQRNAYKKGPALQLVAVYANVADDARYEYLRSLQYRTNLHTARPSKRFLTFQRKKVSRARELYVAQEKQRSYCAPSRGTPQRGVKVAKVASAAN